MGSPLTVALLGGGTVGASVAQLISESADDLTARIGRELKLTGIAVRDASKPRPGVDSKLLTEDAAGLAASGEVAGASVGKHLGRAIGRPGVVWPVSRNGLSGPQFRGRPHAASDRVL